MLSMLSMIEMAIPGYGDIKIHRIFSRSRTRAKQKLQDMKLEEKELDERENKFEQELSDLIRKHAIEGKMGSLGYYPCVYTGKGRGAIYSQNIKFLSTIIPEIQAYVVKYAVLITAFYQFLPYVVK